MRLEGTRKSDLAVGALVKLTWGDERLKTAELAEQLDASPGFMAQVMVPLVKRGWAGSDPGPSGGYRLLVDPAEVSILEVVEVIEGPIDSGMCVVADRRCLEDGECAMHGAWTAARATLVSKLAATSIADVAAAGLVHYRSSSPGKKK